MPPFAARVLDPLADGRVHARRAVELAARRHDVGARLEDPAHVVEVAALLHVQNAVRPEGEDVVDRGRRNHPGGPRAAELPRVLPGFVGRVHVQPDELEVRDARSPPAATSFRCSRSPIGRRDRSFGSRSSLGSVSLRRPLRPRSRARSSRSRSLTRCRRRCSDSPPRRTTRRRCSGRSSATPARPGSSDARGPARRGR